MTDWEYFKDFEPKQGVLKMQKVPLKPKYAKKIDFPANSYIIFDNPAKNN